MRAVIYVIAVLNIIMGLFMVYGRPDVFRGRTLRDAAAKKNRDDGQDREQ